MSVSSDPRRRFGIEFSILARRWRRALDAGLAAVGLTDATWLPLVHLRQTGGGLSQKDLARLVGVDGSSLVRVLDILQARAVIERRADASDGRAKLIHLTAAGEIRVDEIMATLATIEAELLAPLSDAALSQMLEGFGQIDANLNAIAEAEAEALKGAAAPPDAHPSPARAAAQTADRGLL